MTIKGIPVDGLLEGVGVTGENHAGHRYDLGTVETGFTRQLAVSVWQRVGRGQAQIGGQAHHQPDPQTMPRHGGDHRLLHLDTKARQD